MTAGPRLFKVSDQADKRGREEPEREKGGFEKRGGQARHPGSPEPKKDEPDPPPPPPPPPDE